MIASERPRRISLDEWRELLRHSEVKFDYSNGWIFAMAGGTVDHSTVAVNLIHDLADVLGNGSCRVFNSDLAVRLTPTEYRFPDASVSCDASDRGANTEITTPRLIFEVLSDSTEREDRTTKMRLYRSCPTMQEYVFIATRYQAVEVYRRAGELWSVDLYLPGDSVSLNSIGVSLSVDSLYRRTEISTGSRNETPSA